MRSDRMDRMVDDDASGSALAHRNLAAWATRTQSYKDGLAMTTFLSKFDEIMNVEEQAANWLQQRLRLSTFPNMVRTSNQPWGTAEELDIVH